MDQVQVRHKTTPRTILLSKFERDSGNIVCTFVSKHVKRYHVYLRQFNPNDGRVDASAWIKQLNISTAPRRKLSHMLRFNIWRLRMTTVQAPPTSITCE
jgi:hypothetical protein